MSDPMYDVAIVGFGPTGASLANLLALSGHRVLILDREAQMYHLPRAVHFDDEVMRVFQTIGIADDLARAVHVNPGMRFVDEDGTLLLDWPRPQEITPQGWHASYRLHQPDLEKLLRAKLVGYPNVTIACQTRVQSLQEEADCVHLQALDVPTGADRGFKARYVVGCDGANSMVRGVIGGEMEDLGFFERWLVIDLILKRPRPDLGDHSVQFCTSDQPMTYCRGPGMRRRWEITVPEGQSDAESLDEDYIWRLLSKWITPEDATLERKAVYTFRSALARRWQKGRLMIAGDAAHLTPPFMGQGMCTGIRDAANLAWKLSAALMGQGHKALETYQQERAPHARHYVETAMRLGKLINSMDQEGALAMAQEGAASTAQMRSIAPQLGASFLWDQAGVCRDHQTGRPFAQPGLGQGAPRFDDVVGYRHALITDEVPDGPVPDGVVVLTPDDYAPLGGLLCDYTAHALWIRPDRTLGAVSHSATALIEAFFAPAAQKTTTQQQKQERESLT